MGRWHRALALLPEKLAAHMGVSAAALLLAMIVAVPLVLVMARRPGWRTPVLTAAGVVQTVPALALLALFYPLLLLIGGLTKQFAGFGVPALGLLPSLLALALYALLPLLRGGADGLASVPADVLEAADGIGMTRQQRLWRIELPIAAPIMIGGLRTAAVWTLGAATLATTVGQPSLGDLIFAGLQTEDTVLVAVGCLAAAGVALIADTALALVESGVGSRRRGRVVAGIALLVALGLTALVPGLARPAVTIKPVVIGAKNFSEQYVLAELIAARLKANGKSVETRSGLGSSVAFQALRSGEIDTYVDYAGTLWSGPLGHRDTPPRAELAKRLPAELKARFGVTVLAPLGFENAYGLAMRRIDAERLGIRTLADLAAHAGQLRLATDLEFQSRDEWTALQRAYGLKFKALRAYTPTLMVRALTGGDADVITAFTSDGRIAADDLIVLTDPKGALPAYDALLLAAPGRESALRPALGGLAGRIDVAAMRAANWRVDRDVDKQSPSEAAAWLAVQVAASP